MATLNYELIECKSSRLVFLHPNKVHLKRPRLSIAPSHKARGAVGNRFGDANASASLHVPTATATRHEVTHSIILIRTLTKSTYLIKGDLK